MISLRLLFCVPVLLVLASPLLAQCGDIEPVACSYDCTTDTLTLDWVDNPNATAGYTVTENGMEVGTTPAGTSTFALSSPTPGLSTYEVTWTCSLGGGGTPVACSLNVVPAITIPPGTVDLILHQEGLDDGGSLGAIDSGAALEATLVAQGRATFRVGVPDFDLMIANGCFDPSEVFVIWVLTGTFPQDYRISLGEGDALAALNSTGINLYFEGADHWGFTHTDSLLDERDGIEEDLGTNLGDGGDSFTQMDGLNTSSGASFGFWQDVPYQQDQTGSDSTDQLSVVGTTPGAAGDAEVVSAEPIWINSSDGLPDPADPDEGTAYVTGVVATHTQGTIMISQSWELGGFGESPVDRDLVVIDYLSLLGFVDDFSFFVRGDCNDDGVFNIADPVWFLQSLVPVAGVPPTNVSCQSACDANDDGAQNIADAVTMFFALFGPSGVPQPFCDLDSTADALTCDVYSHCP